MKQPKKPTRTQKEVIRSHYLNEKEYMVLRESDFYLTLIHKATGKAKIIDNFIRKDKKR